MRLLEGNQTITLIKHIKGEADAYSCHVLNNASWYGKTTIVTSGEGAKPANTYTVRVPEMPAGVKPDEGDYIARGVVSNITKPGDLKNIEHFRITSVSENMRGMLPHWRVDGS